MADKIVVFKQHINPVCRFYTVDELSREDVSDRNIEEKIGEAA